jgi:hypothetical protein
MSDKLVNPHDAFFKHYLSQPAVASDFLQHHLPAELTALLDLSQLRLEKDSFVDEKLRSYFSDLIYTAMTRDANPVCVAFLAEHKSYTDDWVNFQVLRYKVGYWVQEYEAIQAEIEKQRAEKTTSERAKPRTTLTPIVVVLVYHGKESWQVPLRFARHLTGMEDPASPLSQVLGRYVPDFEPHFINISAMTDEAIRGEVTTRLMMTVLKYIFAERLDDRLGQILALAREVLRQPSGIEMVIALLRYITRSAVKLDKAEITQQLLAYLPKEGGFLMETLAQEWIEEGKSIGLKEGIDIGKKEGIDIGKKEGIDIGKKEGIDIGKKEGIDIGKKEGREVAQRQIVRAMVENGFAQETIARLLNTSEAEVKQLLENLTENDDGASS